MGMTSAENANRGSSSSSKSSVGGGKASNPASKTGSTSSASKSSVGGGKASNPSSKTGTNSTSKASVGGGKSSNPASKTSTASVSRTNSSSSRSSVGGGKASNPSTKTNPGIGPAQNALNSLGNAMKGFTDSVNNALGDAKKSLTDTANASVTKLAKDFTEVKGFTNVVGAGKGWTEVQNADGTISRREGTRAWRNNNPGNIEYGPFAKSMGAIGTDGRFAVFSTPQAGAKAKESLLFGTKAYEGKTINGAISKYAPSFENDTKGYISKVAKAAGVSPDTKMSDLTPAQRSAMMSEMARVEGFKEGKEFRKMDASDSMMTVNTAGKYESKKSTEVGFAETAVNSGAFGDALSAIGSILGGGLASISPTSTAQAGESVNQKKSLSTSEVASISPVSGQSISATSTAKDAPENRPRLGLGKLGQDIEKKDAAQVIKGVAGAIRDPIGFVLSSIEDGWNQNGGLAGLKADLAGGPGLSGLFSGEAKTGPGGSYLDRTVPTRRGNTVDSSGGEQQVAAIDPNATTVTPVTPTKREPFWWSTLVVDKSKLA